MPTIQTASLPDDMLCLLTDYFGAVDLDIPARLNVIDLPLDRLPDIKLGKGDDRGGEAHALAMVGRKMPPVIIADGYLLDGQHRTFAVQIEAQWGRKLIRAIDLSGLGIAAAQFPICELLGASAPRVCA